MHSCVVCHDDIIDRRSNARYCSRKCQRSKPTNIESGIMYLTAPRDQRQSLASTADKLCTYEGCGKPSLRKKKKGLCSMHYQRQKKGADMDRPPRETRSAPADGLCEIDGCTNKYSGDGLCRFHYTRKRRDFPMGWPFGTQRGTPPDGLCKVEDCEDKHHCQGLCAFHYSRQKDGVRFDRPRREKPPTDGLCKVEGCEGKFNQHGFCAAHNQRQKNGRSLDTLIGASNYPVGHTRKTTEGYVAEKTPDGCWVLQHRYVMEQSIKRGLYAHEEVHHKNGQKADNRIENLELWTTSQPRGQRVQDKLEWCREFLAQYEGKQLPIEWG